MYQQIALVRRDMKHARLGKKSEPDRAELPVRRGQITRLDDREGTNGTVMLKRRRYWLASR